MQNKEFENKMLSLHNLLFLYNNVDTQKELYDLYSKEKLNEYNQERYFQEKILNLKDIFPEGFPKGKMESVMRSGLNIITSNASLGLYGFSDVIQSAAENINSSQQKLSKNEFKAKLQISIAQSIFNQGFFEEIYSLIRLVNLKPTQDIDIEALDIALDDDTISQIRIESSKDDQINLLKSEIKKLTSEIEKLTSEIEKLKLQLTQQEKPSDFIDFFDIQDEQIKCLKDEKRSLEEQLSNATGGYSQLRDVIEKQIEEKNQLHKDLENRNQNLSENASTIQRLSEEIEALKAAATQNEELKLKLQRFETLNEQVVAQQKEIEKLKEEDAEQKQIVSKIEHENSQIKSTLHREQQTNAQLQTKITSLSDENKKLQQKNEEYNSTIRNQKVDIQKLTQSKEEIESKKNELQKTNGDLNTKLQALTLESLKNINLDNILSNFNNNVENKEDFTKGITYEYADQELQGAANAMYDALRNLKNSIAKDRLEKSDLNSTTIDSIKAFFNSIANLWRTYIRKQAAQQSTLELKRSALNSYTEFITKRNSIPGVDILK